MIFYLFSNIKEKSQGKKVLLKFLHKNAKKFHNWLQLRSVLDNLFSQNMISKEFLSQNLLVNLTN